MTEHRERLAGESFDLLVIGGGINGCGIARDAAMRGLRTALVERDDFGSGTSGRTSRLIHGGLRYLEHGHLGLVAESLRERKTLLEIAPHLVSRLAFVWPVYRKARVSRTKLRAGMVAYDLLSIGSGPDRHGMLTAQQVAAHEPKLRRGDLLGGALYYDAATDDARLTLENALSAAYWGAVVVNHASAERRPGGATVTDSFTGTSFFVEASEVVRAIGPWSAAARGSKGVHIAVPRSSIGNEGAVTIVSPVDGRVMFVLPDGERTIVGTTDTFTSSHPEAARATSSDVRYLLDSVRAYFPESEVTESDVIAAWAGVRPLARALTESSPGASSREHDIYRSDDGALEVSGGKLTTYRAVAEETVDFVETALGRRRTPCRTAQESLPGGDRDAAIEALIKENPAAGRQLDCAGTYKIADLLYAIQNEMALTLSDLLLRRTRIAFETSDHGLGAAKQAAAAIAPILGWSAENQRARVEEYEKDVRRVFTVEPPISEAG